MIWIRAEIVRGRGCTRGCLHVTNRTQRLRRASQRGSTVGGAGLDSRGGLTFDCRAMRRPSWTSAAQNIPRQLTQRNKADLLN